MDQLIGLLFSASIYFLSELCPKVSFKYKCMKQKYISAGCMCLLFALTVSCTEVKRTEGSAQSVEVVYPKPANATKVKELSGVVKENSTLSLSFETGGRVESINVKEGDYVKAGQIIAQLRKDDYELSVKALQTQRDLAYRDAMRKKRMHEQKALSGNEYESAQTMLENLDAQLEIQKNKYEYTYLKAPVNGFIQKVNMHEGELAGIGSCVATMLDLSRMEVEVGLPFDLYKQRSLFGDANCCLAGNPDKKYPLDEMKVIVKSDGNQLYKVLFRIRCKEDKEITAGMNVVVHIPVEQENKDVSIMLPSSSICKDALGSPYVYVVNQEHVLNKVEVAVVGLEGDYICINGDLSTGSKVVKAGVHSLNEGQKVKIIQTTSPTNKGDLI